MTRLRRTDGSHCSGTVRRPARASRSARRSGRRAGLDGAPVLVEDDRWCPAGRRVIEQPDCVAAGVGARRPFNARACPDDVPVGEGVRSATLRTIKGRSTVAAGLRSLSPAAAVVGTRAGRRSHLVRSERLVLILRDAPNQAEAAVQRTTAAAVVWPPSRHGKQNSPRGPFRLLVECGCRGLYASRDVVAGRPTSWVGRPSRWSRAGRAGSAQGSKSPSSPASESA